MSDVAVIHGDMRDVLGKMIAEGKVVQSVVTDPPYHLTSIVSRYSSPDAKPPRDGGSVYTRNTRGFMGKVWDGGDIAFQPGTWRLCFELLPPGGHLLAFAGTRTYHRMVVAIEEAGFEIRDTIAWLYGSGFPKSHNVSKGIDKAAGAEREVVGSNPNHRAVSGVGYDGIYAGGNTGAADITAPATDAARQWDGWGTALKPAMELICVARKPLVGTVAANVLAHGTGALNIDATRIKGVDDPFKWSAPRGGIWKTDPEAEAEAETEAKGRWPSNVVTDGSDEVVKAFPSVSSHDTQDLGGLRLDAIKGSIDFKAGSVGSLPPGRGDSGSAARFFYSSKADSDDRLGSKHPTIKPVDLLRWLVRLVTPPGGTVLDCFAGSGTTGMACMAEGFDCILIEREDEYVKDIRARIAHVHGEDTPLFSGVML